MNKILYILLALLLVGGLGYYFLVSRCEQPDELSVVALQLKCAQNIYIPAFRVELCQQQHGSSICDLDETDREAGFQLFFSKVNSCAKAELKRTNKCIDKYKDVQ
jgi:hypothetical protein